MLIEHADQCHCHRLLTQSTASFSGRDLDSAWWVTGSRVMYEHLGLRLHISVGGLSKCQVFNRYLPPFECPRRGATGQDSEHVIKHW